jgi:hypothetical protein
MLGRRFKSSRESFGQVYGGSIARSKRSKLERDVVLYGGPIASVGLAFGIASAHYSIFLCARQSFSSILPAIALSFWYGRQRSGILAFALSTVCLFSNFFSAEPSRRTRIASCPTIRSPVRKASSSFAQA